MHLDEEDCKDMDSTLRGIFEKYKELPFVKVSPRRFFDLVCKFIPIGYIS